MTATELKRLLKRSGMSGRRTAKALAIDERTMRRYTADDAEIPRTVELAVLYLIEHPEVYAAAGSDAEERRSRSSR